MLWAPMKKYVRSQLCKTDQEIGDAIEDYRLTPTPEICQSYIDKLKEIIRAVIEKNGGWSNY